MLYRRTLRTRRRGVLALELLLILPILLLLVLAMVQFSLTLYARQQLVAASREACRVAALGGNLGDVEQMVHKVLGGGRIADAEIEMTDETGATVPSGRAVPSGEAIAVWLRLPTAYAVPDLLRFVGYSIRGDELVARTMMRRE